VGGIRRSVSEVRQLGWIGWDRLARLVEEMGRMDLKALVAFLFLSGLRISEALAVREDMVSTVSTPDGDFIQISQVPLLKRWKKIGVYYDEEGRRRIDRKPVTYVVTKVWPVYEPLNPYFMDYVWHVRKYVGRGAKLWRFGRRYAHKVIQEKTGAFPHFFRALRAVQLATEYGFTSLQLKEFFKWEDLKTVFTYAALSTTEVAKAFPRKKTDIFG